MRKFLFFGFLIATAIANGQNVNFADEDFKEIMITQEMITANALDINGNFIIMDSNSDGEIQVTEALQVYQLVIVGTASITSIEGVEAFTNLRSLNISQFTGLSTINISDLANLETLYMYDCTVGSLDVSALTNLKSASMWNAGISSINVAGLSNLESLNLYYEPLISLDLTGLVGLKTLVCDSMSNLGSAIDFSDLVSIEEIRCTAMITTYFTSVTFGEHPYLHKLILEMGSEQYDLDLSGCPALEQLSVMWDEEAEDEVLSLNLKNGNNSYTYLNVTNAIDYVCIDEGEEGYFATILNQNPDLVLSTYCSFTPGGSYNTITGTFGFDGENDGCELEDNLGSFNKILISDGAESGLSYTDSQGAYHFYTEAGNFTLTPQFENNWFTATPASATVALAEVNNTVTTQSFCITANGVHPDVEVILIPLSIANPGFDAFYKIVFKNKGNQTLSGSVALVYDDALLDYVAALPVETNASAGALIWDYSNLLPFESRSMIVTLNVNSQQETPAVNANDVLTFTMAVTPAAGDEAPADNTFTLDHTVTASFDPNDITCLEGDTAAPEAIGEYLHYNINFENTGTAAATFIVVKDVIDATQFDIATLEVLDASHNMQARITGNKIEFYFDDINLGATEKGNVAFKIRTLNTLQVNNDVTQQAEIFFDYNWPIETNEATTTFAALSSGEFAMDESVKVYPNPSNGIVNIEADSTIQSLELFDVQGRLLQSSTINEVTGQLDISQRATGMYFLKIRTEKGIKVEKLVRE